MTEFEARQALWLRAHEQPLSPPWTAVDGEAVTRQALQGVGEHAGADEFIAARARHGVERLAQRDPANAAALAATGPQPALRWVLFTLALLAGALSDAVGAAQRINILAPPLLALLVWNLAVYLVLAWSALRQARSTAPGPLRRTLTHALQRWALPAGGTASRFAADWWQLAAPLHGARLAAMLHTAAALFAAAAVASLYVRGLGFEYRAGWDSTFLSPAGVRKLLSAVFAPALALTGGTLPGADALAALRFSAGAGENAARWIHWQALTVALVVVLPRAVLAGVAAFQARRRALNFALPLDEPYFARLARLPRGEVIAVTVLPYSYQLPPAALPGLTSVLERALGSGVQLTLAAAVPLGGEDDAASFNVPAESSAVALFALTATPERENHAAFVTALAARLPAPGRLLVLVDESGFRQRFTGDATRLAQRRAAWQRLLAEAGHTATFADLLQPEPA